MDQRMICCYRELQIIHTDLKPENVMLGVPLASREWRIPASSGTCKELMAAYMAEAKAANRQVTKNQKKKLKRKFKKQLSMGQTPQPMSTRGDDDSSAACLDEGHAVEERKNGTNSDASGVAESQECAMVRFMLNLLSCGYSSG
jgi:serine/threonine-protein kinase SRPK3